MASKNQNFEMYSGESKVLEVTVRKKNKILNNLRNMSVFWALKKSSHFSDGNLVEKTSANGIEITGDGKILIKINEADTKKLKGNYYHVCRLVDVTGNSTIIFTGIATFKHSGI